MELTIKHFNNLTINELYDILKVRAAVFVVEQNCPYQDMDDKDQNAYHLFLKENNEIQAYARILDKGVSFDEMSIGRVISVKRGSGLGSQILDAAINFAKNKLNADYIKLPAQVYAKGFYEKHNFKQVSEEFLEDGIPHIHMLLKL